MGAWGTKPDENDSSADLFFEQIRIPMNRSLSKLFKKVRVDPNERWARVGVVYKLLMEWPKVPINADTFAAVLDDLDVLSMDEQWQSEWQRPDRVRDVIRSFAKLVAKAEREERF